MYQDVIIAGFGGQGVMLIGNLLAYAGMNLGLQVTYMPVYGVEMRGGTANCTVVLSDQEIGSPIIYQPGSLIAMNQPSLEKFGPRLLPQGKLIYNSSIIQNSPELGLEQEAWAVPANQLANELGDTRMANMVILGAWVQAVGAVGLQAVQESLQEVISSRNQHLMPINRQALEAGAEHVSSLAAQE
ncbi:MAG: 2-oxoacid:acceptor oxidoreductase family protein [Desulfohalobiaceae bacterium]